MKTIIIARVSTEEQKEAGNSLPAQITRLEKYCERKNFQIIKKFSFDETAYKNDRNEFDEILDYVIKQKEQIAVCFDKVDRLSRNVFDKRVATLYKKALADKIELHFSSDNQVINSKMSAAEQFHFGISLNLAKYYSDAISDNVKRAQVQILTSGRWPAKPPVGYLRDENKDILIDPNKGPLVRKGFELYSTGTISINGIRLQLSKLGFKNSRNKIYSKGKIHNILKNPFYCGFMPWNNNLYEGNYEPLVSKKLFDKVQSVKEGYHKKPFKHASKNLAFRGLITCANCGCRITGEIKKGKYIYWHCTNYHGNCKRDYIPEQTLDDQIISLLKDMAIPDNKLDMLITELKKSHEDKISYHSSVMTNLQSEYNRIESHLETMYEDHLDRRITKDQYDKLLEKKKKRQEEVLNTMETHRRADKTYYITAERLLTLASHAVDYYKSSKPDEKRQLLSFLLSNCQLDGQNLNFTLKKPFDTILLHASRSAWLRGLDSNQQQPL